MLRYLAASAVSAVAVLAFATANAQPSESQAAAEALDPLAEVEAAEPTPEDMENAILEFESSLQHQKGRIAIPSAHVTLNVPEGFYFLDAADANTVLTEGWGNPPDTSVSGMLFPEGMSPLDQGSWGVVLTYEDTGYVSDEDASSIDYDMLIDVMREGAESENPARKAQGYPEIEIIGWAAQPRYDSAAHKLYWAKELVFDKDPAHTLNYDMRVLGRHGVLSLNFVAGLEQLNEIEQASASVLAIPEFDQGFRYGDFNSATDAKADYGIAGLIGGAAAATALAKNGGIIGALLLFLKKGWVLIFGAIAAIGAGFRALFNRKPKAEVQAEQRASTAFFDGPSADQTGPAGEATPQEPQREER